MHYISKCSSLSMTGNCSIYEFKWQLLRDILWPGIFRHSTCESVRFNIKFTYLMTVDVSWGFWFIRVIQNMLKTQYKCRLYLAKSSDCSSLMVPVWLPLLVSNMFTVTVLGLPSCWEGIHGLKPGQAHCSLKCFW